MTEKNLKPVYTTRTFDILDEWFSEQFGQRQKHPVVRIRTMVQLPVTLQTRIIVHV